MCSEKREHDFISQTVSSLHQAACSRLKVMRSEKII
ncbi:hypothetical protein PYVVs3_gp1 [Potato yellow vein virus]|uniref:p4 n=1 Tax=Potato yellow vein virus TaxID=103881 RepID=Q80B15_9CLOS|nr:hypothetical protein PYVVs3_gp1 [Potato yellow vein virus]AMR69010.1 hypothetical protein [Potato yellow vein virus]AYJ76770.1 p4 [Potato yellow vein virus]QEY87995.1 hypothetical protein [Potato yellow vein virus]QHW06862.1 p4 [Potato yellow vein virus]QTP76589.1 p4 [Potato yellow vein virus]